MTQFPSLDTLIISWNVIGMDLFSCLYIMKTYFCKSYLNCKAHISDIAIFYSDGFNRKS